MAKKRAPPSKKGFKDGSSVIDMDTEDLPEKDEARRSKTGKSPVKKSTPKGSPSSAQKRRKESQASRQQLHHQQQQQEIDTDDSKPNKTTDEPDAEEEQVLPKTMDVSVHRMRHLQYLPKHILCMRATPVVPDDDDAPASSSYLAISRENGTVELKAPNEKFRTIAEIAGFRTKPVNVMTWVCGARNSHSHIHDSSQSGGSHTNSPSRPTLVGGSRDGTLFIIDFQKGLLTGIIASGGGGVFALASLCQQCRGDCCSSSNHQDHCCPQLVAAGCEDGSIRIFQVGSDYRTLQLVSILPSGSGASVLSLAWRRLPTTATTTSASTGCHGTVLFAGVADGTIRRYECANHSSKQDDSTTGMETAATTGRNYTVAAGSWKSTVRMTVESLGRNTPTRVWALQALSDGTVVSGDSLGHVQFWDGETGTLLQSFDQNDNKADVLDLVVASEQNKVFASGVDSRVVCIERPSPAENMAVEECKWIMSQAQRPHTHDVKGMTVCRQRIRPAEGSSSSNHNKLPTPTKDACVEILCTGGIDTKLCVYFVEDFKKKRPKSLYPWPAFSPVSQARQARVVVIRREIKIDLYILEAPAQPSLSDSSYSVSETEAYIGTIEVESSCNLVDVTISDDGEYLAACDALSLLLFRLEYVRDSNGVKTAMIPAKLSFGSKLKSSIVSMQFGCKNQLVAASSDGALHVIDMPDDPTSTTATLGATLKQKKILSRDEEVLFPTQSIEFSHNKKWFAAIRGGLGSSSIRIFSCEDDGSVYRHWWSLPDLEAPSSAVKFLEAGDDGGGSSPLRLVVACANFAFYVFDIRQRRLSPWSEQGGVPISDHLPAELMGRNDYPIRIASNPASPNKMLLGSFGSFAVIDLDKTLPKFCKFVPQRHVRRWGNKRKRSSSDVVDNNKPPPARDPDDVEAIICLRYNSILHMDFVDENEMVVVEQPWLDVIATFPPALDRKLYGS